MNFNSSSYYPGYDYAAITEEERDLIDVAWKTNKYAGQYTKRPNQYSDYFNNYHPITDCYQDPGIYGGKRPYSDVNQKGYDPRCRPWYNQAVFNNTKETFVGEPYLSEDKLSIYISIGQEM